ncbi:uncharacterized protein LOC114742540 isoform X1 [Neltuma alba]|uniref:uncharacterized protein LOC114722473 isoform X1 n=1 Tax=Neltuma alba TaxID=207710 RepID=UPI0010A3B2CA|nr:uncharacterized protein LOC114722473 isoform X1 [Prosopis alba]XP_028786603.1 uncharacterized protein LOC114742540 isoform X1 [Prosopis alba]
MEESAIVEKQSQRKRSSSDNNAFAKFVPLASPLGDDGASQEANLEAEGHDNGRKRLKPNSPSEFAYISSSSSSPLLKQSMAQDNQQFSSPSTMSKHSTDTRPSPSSIASKSNIAFEALDTKSSQDLSAGKFNCKEDRFELGPTGSMAAEQLSKRPKSGGIYEAIRVHRESTLKRLRELCNEEPTIDVGIEMADVASLLKLMSSSTDEIIESAGQKAHRGALLLLQAEILRKNGLQLLSESQNSFKDIL